MNLSIIDLSIIAGYLVATIFIGYYLSKHASKSISHYFLGGQRIPWYCLGVSNASGMFDITGTMWTVTILYVYGLKSVFLPWLWPVWNQIFLMIFLAVWMRRSNVMTGAEWLKTRFGDNRGSQLSHLIVVLFALVAVIGFITYGFKGIGKFSQIFFEWDLSLNLGPVTVASEDVYAILIMGITTLYVIKGGMYSVVFTEVLQFFIMTIACFAIGIIAFTTVSAEQIAEAVPSGWDRLGFGWRLNLDWSGILPAVNDRMAEDGYSLFSLLMMMMIFKGILVSIAGPVPGYDMQRVLATETPKDAAKMSGIVSLVLFIPRYLMIAGLTVIALVHLREPFQEMAQAGDIDFEIVLPYTIQHVIPIGIKGILLAGLVAAFMSTFAANVNAGPAYIVNDIYKKFFNPNASQATYMRMSYLASFAMVLIGIFFGFFVTNIDRVLNWIVGALFGGYIAANVLKWIWWRFNGYGYFAGMVSGLVFSGIIPFVFKGMQPIYIFPVTFGLSFVTSIVVSLMTPPEPDGVLLSFYESVRPWGWWRPVYDKLKLVKPEALPNRDFGRDVLNCVVGIAWQTSLILLPIYLLIKQYRRFSMVIILLLGSSFFLYKYWYQRLKDHPDD